MSERAPFQFTFVTDCGTEKMTYAGYLARPDLRKKVNDQDMARLFLGRTIILFSKDFLAGSDPHLEMFSDLEEMWKTNPIQFFAPSSFEAQDAINDWEHDVVVRIGPNRTAKTTDAMIKLLIGAIPMNKDWPIFTEHGIQYRPFREPVDLAVASYKEKNLRDTIWPRMIRFWTPDEQLGIYGKKYKGSGAKAAPPWGHDTKITLKCETNIAQYTYEQDQDVFESGVFHRWLWDEQGRENLFGGADERCRTVKGIHLFSLTPHKVEGRGDTGAGSFIHRMLKGEQRMGHNPKSYITGIREMPDWIYPESEKEKAFEKWEHEPKRSNNQRMLREGRARLYGEWHSTAGLVITTWQPEYSWIDPLWEHPPAGWTLYRGVDHGKVNPTAILSLAINKDLDIVLYREIYTKGDSPFQNVKRAVELSGNSLRRLPDMRNDNVGVIIERYEEVYESEHFAKQVLDSRSFAGIDDGTSKPVGWLYKCAGMNVTKASGLPCSEWVPLLEEYLTVDPNRKHLVTGKMGAPRMYVFNTCVNWRREVESWHMKETPEGKNESESPADKDNHAMTATGYAIQIPLRFLGDVFQPKRKSVPTEWWQEKQQKQIKRETTYRRV